MVCVLRTRIIPVDDSASALSRAAPRMSQEYGGKKSRYGGVFKDKLEVGGLEPEGDAGAVGAATWW